MSGLSGDCRHPAPHEIDGPQAVDSAELKARRGREPFAAKVKFETTVLAQLLQATK